MIDLSNVLFFTTVLLGFILFPFFRPIILGCVCYVLTFFLSEPVLSQFGLAICLTLRFTILCMRVSIVYRLALYYRPSTIQRAFEHIDD
jgi:hypothetical protein